MSSLGAVFNFALGAVPPLAAAAREGMIAATPSYRRGDALHCPPTVRAEAPRQCSICSPSDPPALHAACSVMTLSHLAVHLGGRDV